MNVIAKTQDSPLMLSPLPLSAVSDRLWLDPGDGIVARLGRILAQRAQHPSRMLVLLP
jgi:hypothetical protein